MVGAPSVAADASRAAVTAALVTASVLLPASAPLMLPFIPVLVSLRRLRSRAAWSRFLTMATAASLVGVVGAVAFVGFVAPFWLAAAAAFALLSVPVLGWVHTRAARPDPATGAHGTGWPEPMIQSGFPVALGGWTTAIVVLAALMIPAVDAADELVRSQVIDGYAVYTTQCEPDGALADNGEVCDDLLAQRDEAVSLVERHPLDIIAAFAALVAVGCAGTAHPIIVGRARRIGGRVRPMWRLRDLEMHWASAYLLAAGLAGWTLATTLPSSTAADAGRVVSVFVGTIGGMLVLAQGIGLATWLLVRGRTPGWYRVLLVVAALFVLPFTALVLLGLGMIDLARSPRRRAAESGSVRGRGSGG